MANEKRPYVVPTLKDGLIILLDDEQHEFKLAPYDAAELAIQILRAYCQTFPFGVEVPVPDLPYVSGGVSGPGQIVGLIDPDTLGMGSITSVGNGVVAKMKTTEYRKPKFPVYQAIKDSVLREVRHAIGIGGPFANQL